MRFPGFDGDWKTVKLGDITVKINSGKTPLGGEAVYTKSGVIFIRSQNVNNDKLELENSTFIPESVNNQMKNSIVKPNDILLNITGASLGRSCVVPKDFETGNVNQHVCIIRLSQKYNPRFIQPIFSSKKGQITFNSLQTGSGREGLNFESIKGIKISIPTSEEQRKIASLLTLIEERIQTQNKIIKELNVLKTILLKRIFSKELRFKCKNRDEFPKWEIKKLGQIGVIVNGLTYNPNDIDEKGLLVLRSSNIQNRKLVFDNNVFVTTTNYNPVKENDILICVRNGSKDLIGKNAIIKREYENLAFGAFMSVYRSPFNQYIFQWFDTTEYKEIIRRNLGATINSINGSDLKKFPVPFPSIPEQQKIVGFLSSIDSKIDVEVNFLNKLQEQKTFFLQRMFV